MTTHTNRTYSPDCSTVFGNQIVKFRTQLHPGPKKIHRGDCIHLEWTNPAVMAIIREPANATNKCSTCMGVPAPQRPPGWKRRDLHPEARARLQAAADRRGERMTW